MKINYISRLAQILALMFFSLSLAAQNLDPTVEVSRQYEGKLMEVHKPQLKMAVPDSVLRFDLEFDYSVTDKPYKGAYEFSPYTVDMRPSPTVYAHKTLYLNLGAGYSLHPELDFVWSPKFRTKAFRMDVYASHRSFFGNYWDLNQQSVSNGAIIFGRPDDLGTWKGYDITNKAGVSGRLDWEKGLFSFDVGYRGLMQDDDAIDNTERYYDAVDLKFVLASKRQSGFLYSLDADFTYAGDDVHVLYYTQDAYDARDVKELDFGFDAALGFKRENGNAFLVNLGIDAANIEGVLNYSGLDLDIVPHYVRESERWNFDLGLRFSPAVTTSRFTDTYGPEGQIVYPDVRIEYMAARDVLKFYLDVGGDAKVNSYSDLLTFNRYANADYCRIPWDLIDASEEKVNASVGAEMKIGPHFSFDLKGGYVMYAGVLMEGLYMVASSDKLSSLKPALGYGSYNKAFAALDWLLDTESVSFDGSVEYAYSRAKEDKNIKGLFLPAALKGDVSFMYNWNKRIFAGVDCEFSTARKGSAIYPESDNLNSYNLGSMPTEISGYADLGVNLSYNVNRKFSVWARGGNLLGMTIQRSILYAEKGPYFTAGICLNL